MSADNPNPDPEDNLFSDDAERDLQDLSDLAAGFSDSSCDSGDFEDLDDLDDLDELDEILREVEVTVVHTEPYDPGSGVPMQIITDEELDALLREVMEGLPSDEGGEYHGRNVL